MRMRPVSYTHLDVYKRQGVVGSFTSFVYIIKEGVFDRLEQDSQESVFYCFF